MTESQRRQLDAAARQDLATLELEEEMAQRIAEMKTDRIPESRRNQPGASGRHVRGIPGSGQRCLGGPGGHDSPRPCSDRRGAPILVSIPRDLYVRNPCHEGWSRINAALGGCEGLASGTELIALMVQGYTGIEVDHVARLTFDGFASVVNALGG